MTPASKRKLVRRLLEAHGQTFSAELGVHLERGSPSALFQWLCASVLLSAPIGHRTSMKAARSLFRHGWTSAQRLANSTWQERVRALDEAGYVRYDEQTSTMLGDVARLALERYRGDLRKLRDAAGEEPATERELIREFKGIGPVGVDIFCREVQIVWDELFPYDDPRALEVARRLGLADDVRSLQRLVSHDEYPRLLAALIRVRLAREYEQFGANRYGGGGSGAGAPRDTLQP